MVFEAPTVLFGANQRKDWNFGFAGSEDRLFIH
jgi:hypothetical protein